MLNVSERSVASATKVLAAGEAELVRSVEQAKLKVSAAARAAKLDPELQHQVAVAALAGDAKAARTIIARALSDRRRDGPVPLRQMLHSAKRTNTELRKALQEANDDFIALHDPLTGDVAAKAAELVALAAADDVVAKDELAALALHYHWRLRDLIAEVSHSTANHTSLVVADANKMIRIREGSDALR